METAHRVLHCVVNLNRGGAETLLMNLYRSIDRSQMQFDFLTCNEGVYDAEVIEKGGRIYRIPYLTKVGPAEYVRQLRRFFYEHPEYTIVHSHMDKMSGIVLREAKKSGIPVRIAHSHNTRSEGNAAVRLFKAYGGSFLAHSATDRFACSKAAAQWLFGNQVTDVRILNNGVQAGEFRFSPTVREDVRGELKVGPSTLLLGHVGRFQEQKNHRFLLDILERLLPENPNVKLVLVGEGPLLSKIKVLAEEKGVFNHILFLGSRGDVNRVLQAMDVFCFPSLHEGLPVTLIEAQAAGLPCLVSERVTGEADLGVGLMKFLPIIDPLDWVKAIGGYSPNQERPVIDLAACGYDIDLSANALMDFYCDKFRTGREL